MNLVPRNYFVVLFFFRKGDYTELTQTDETNALPLRQHRIRHEQSLEAEVLPGDSLASIALRFNTSVQEIKRLNKIDKDNEIFAFKVLKVPLTAHNILLDTLPKVHKSGQSSPNSKEKVPSSSSASDAIPKAKLEEKLLIASVSQCLIEKSEDAADHSVTNEVDATSLNDVNNPLLFRGYPKTLGAPRNEFLSFSGSDCELNWIVLLFCILAICVIVPLIYVYLVYEHPENFHHTHSKYDDTDLKQLHHLDDKYVSSTFKS